MSKKYRFFVLILTLGCLLISLTACSSHKKAEESSSEVMPVTEGGYPSKSISAIIQWGAGGGTDTLMRPLAKLVESEIGQSLVVENQPGAIGSEATQYVYNQPADGYTLLMGAENPQLYKALDLIDLSYDDFEPVIVIGNEVTGIVVRKDSPYQNLKELIQASLLNPGTLKLATTGEGGLPWEASSFLTAVTGATFKQVPYDSDATAKQAVMDGACDLTICKLQTVIDDYDENNLIFLSMLSSQPVASFEDVPLITDEYPEFAQFLPWGPFTGVFVSKDTDPEVLEQLREAFQRAYNNSEYQELLQEKNINGLGLTGDEAKTYLKDWQKKTLTALVNSDAIDKSLSDLDLESE